MKVFEEGVRECIWRDEHFEEEGREQQCDKEERSVWY